MLKRKITQSLGFETDAFENRFLKGIITKLSYFMYFFSDFIGLASLPQRDQNFTGNGTLYGWGSTSYDDTSPTDQLMKVNLPIWEDQGKENYILVL